MRFLELTTASLQSLNTFLLGTTTLLEEFSLHTELLMTVNETLRSSISTLWSLS